MTIKPGDTLPSATLTQMSEKGPLPVTTDELFKGKRVVLFALPGAFTPTCSARHLPGFVEQADEIKKHGVADVICLSVNDAFVMNAWGREHKTSGRVHMVADGNAEFTKKVGLAFDGSKFGMGERSQRYAMIVNDGKVEKLFVEDAGGFSVSSAENVLANL